MIHTCPRCGREFGTKLGLNIHLRYYDPEKGCAIKYWGTSPPTPEDEALEEMSDRNILRGCNGKIKKLTRGQIRVLKRRGIIKIGYAHSTRWSKTSMKTILTAKGIKMLEELKNETAKI